MLRRLVRSSSSWWRVSSRSSTPYSTAPIFRKKRNSGHRPNGAAAPSAAVAIVPIVVGPAGTSAKSNAGGPLRRVRLSRSRISGVATPAPSRMSSSWIPRKPLTVASSATAIDTLSFRAVRDSRQSACSTITTTTGLTP